MFKTRCKVFYEKWLAQQTEEIPDGRDLNLQKLNYQYLTTSVAVVLVVR